MILSPPAILALSLVLPGGAATAAEISSDDSVGTLDAPIRAYLDRKAAAESAAGIYVSKLVRGDIDGNGKADAYVSYSLESASGGNFTLLYEALFVVEKDQLVFKAERDNGSSGTAQGESFSPKRIEAGRILGEILAYAPDDGACCPSIKRAASVSYAGGKLGAAVKKAD
ncbi:hypothetical protein DFR29_105199 [Tahibacter aquaticus]|uniref:Uncharacterized protein n=1 Tax=Tahibacter aquaticus TaxID=520092 RepID=A0A4V3DMK4_9GAMM|nr:hypothetical protein [Tahibacter aquaticus]TDR45016.1 hypothetical protein DFR29_105199 [Tahibacter aquaticus]